LTPHKQDVQWLEALEMWFWFASHDENRSWMEQKTNEEVLEAERGLKKTQSTSQYN